MNETKFQSNDDIVSRADAFMNRQRSVAPPPPADDFDDLPVLTDVVTPSPQASHPDLEALSHALAEAISKQLAAEIPTLVEASMQAALNSIAWDIRQGLDEITRKAIAERQVKTSQTLVIGYEQQFRVGSRSLLDLLTVQRDLYDAQSNAVFAAFDERVVKGRMIAAIGQLATAYTAESP